MQSGRRRGSRGRERIFRNILGFPHFRFDQNALTEMGFCETADCRSVGSLEDGYSWPVGLSDSNDEDNFLVLSMETCPIVFVGKYFELSLVA